MCAYIKRLCAIFAAQKFVLHVTQLASACSTPPQKHTASQKHHRHQLVIFTRVFTSCQLHPTLGAAPGNPDQSSNHKSLTAPSQSNTTYHKMSTHRQSRGPRKVLNEADLERKQLESGSSTPVWLKPKPQHALAQIHAKAKSKVEAKEERNKRATKRSSSDDKENNGGKKKAATKTTKRAPNPAPLPAELPVATTQPVAAASQPQQDTRQATPPPAKRARTELPPMVRNEDPATASGRSNATPAPCMTEEEFTTWLAQQPGMMVPADQHRELLVCWWGCICILHQFWGVCETPLHPECIP